MPSPAILVLIGCTTGLLAGTLGAGGGFATVVLLLASGAGAHHAIGTAPVFTIVVGAAGTAVHLRRGTASPWLAVALGLPSAATAQLGAFVAEYSSDRSLTLAFACLTFVVAVAFLTRRAPKPEDDPQSAVVEGAAVPPPGSRRSLRPTRGLVAGAMAGGAIIGFMNGLFGVGGGFLLVPFMVLLLGVPEHLAVGSSLFAILIGSISSGARHWLYGNVDWDLLAWLIPGGVAGSWVGAIMVKRISAPTIRRAFITLMLSSTAYLLVKSF